jgi:hypothetical protein
MISELNETIKQVLGRDVREALNLAKGWENISSTSIIGSSRRR